MINKVVMQEIYLTKFDKTNKCSDLYKVKKVVLNQTKYRNNLSVSWL